MKMKSYHIAAAAACIVAPASILISRNVSIERPETYEQQYWVEEYATGLNRPRALVWLPEGRQLVALWDGSIKELVNGKPTRDVTGGPKVWIAPFQGLRDMKLDPDFPQNGFVYLSYVAGRKTDVGSEVVGKVWRAKLQGNVLIDGREIFSTKVNKSSFLLMGPLLFLPDKTLLVPVGSMSQGEISMVQRPDNHSGKIIRINRDGSIPRDNPFYGHPGTLPEIFATGLRNPSGITRREDGSVWVTDIGPKGGDELNLLEPGKNYGWPDVTWGFEYSGEAMGALTGSPKQDNVPGMTDPVLVWVPSQVPSDLVEYVGKEFPFWNNDLFTGGLASHTLRRLRIRDGKVILQEAMLTELQERLRTVQQGPDGFLYVLTDAFRNGRILRIRPGRPPKGARIAKRMVHDDEPPKAYLPDDDGRTEIMNNYVYTVKAGEGSFDQYCAACHSYKKFKSGKIGPDLNGVDGRVSGSLPNFSYTQSFQDPQRRMRWNKLNLYSFLNDPETYFPGTAMVLPPLSYTDKSNIIIYLTGADKADDGTEKGKP